MRRVVTAALALLLVAAGAVPALAHGEATDQMDHMAHMQQMAAEAAGQAPAAEAHAAQTPAVKDPAVLVNGQMLLSFGHRGPHVMSSHVYVAVEDFAWITGSTYQWNPETSELTFNGKAVKHDWSPAFPIHDNTVYAPAKVLGELLDGGKVEWDDATRTVVITFAGQTTAAKLGLPTGVTRISPTVPAMGEHWANPATLPFGPIYLVHNNKVIGWEVMMSQADFVAGKSWSNVSVHNVGPVNHVDIEFTAHGHDGFMVPHYDIHAYTITPEEKAQIK